MAQDIEKLVLSIEANTKQLERSMKKVEATVNGTMKKSAGHAKKFNAALAASQRHMAMFLKTMAGAVAIGSLAQLPGVIGDLVSQTGDIGKVADKVGLTTQSLQELRFAAELTGLSTGQLDTGMQRFARRLAEAANGSGELLGILKANNVALRNADGSMRSQNELLDEYADLIKNAGSEQEQLLLAFKGFDTEGAAMVNVLRDGSAGLRTFRQEAHDTGGVIEEDLIREMEELDDRFQRLARTISINLKTAVLETVSAFSDMAEGLKDYENQSIENLKKQLANAREIAAGNEGNSFGESFAKEAAVIEAVLAKRIEQEKELKKIRDETDDKSNKNNGSNNRSTIIPSTGGGEDGQEAKIQRVIEGLRRQTLAMTESSEAQRVNNALAQAGVGINSEYGQQIAQAARELDALVMAQMKLNDAMSLAESAGMSIFDSLADGAGDLGETIQDLTKDIARMLVQSSLFGTGGLANIMGTSQSSGGSGGAIGSLMASLMPQFGGARAAGGPVNAGKAYLVGEKGPEMIVPGHNGTVIPNFNLQPPQMPMRGGGDNNVQVNIVNNSGEDIQQERRSEGGVDVIDVVVGRVETSMARGGFDDTLGTSFGAKRKVRRR